MHEKQVDYDHYRFGHYCGLDRWSSYHHQLEEIIGTNPESVLEAGPGDHVVGSYLKRNTNIKYTSVDIADDVGADVTGDLTKLPFEDNAFDIVCAFEVLEHLPYEQFEVALSEMLRVAKKHVMVSVPHFGPPVKFLLKIPFLPEIKFAFKVPFPKPHVWNGQHYWEIGKKDYPPSRIRASITKHARIIKEYVPFEHQYHRFYVIDAS